MVVHTPRLRGKWYIRWKLSSISSFPTVTLTRLSTLQRSYHCSLFIILQIFIEQPHQVEYDTIYALKALAPSSPFQTGTEFPHLPDTSHLLIKQLLCIKVSSPVGDLGETLLHGQYSPKFTINKLHKYINRSIPITC